MSGTELAWFKSSYSDSEGSACVEVAASWRRSSRSGTDGDARVEVAARPDAVHVRDSKDRSGPKLDFTPAAWADFVAFAARQPLP